MVLALGVVLAPTRAGSCRVDSMGLFLLRLHVGLSPHPVEKTEEARIVSKRGQKRIEADGGLAAKAPRDTKLETSDRLVPPAEDGENPGDVVEDQSRAVAVELARAPGQLDRMVILP